MNEWHDSMDIRIPFPEREWSSDVKQTPIKECGEKMVPMSYAPGRILVRPQYYLQGLDGALSETFMRESVYMRLIEAAEKLPRGYHIIVYDAWRPQIVQRSLFEAMRKRVRAKNTGMSDEEVKNATMKYVALPTEDKSKASPHSTGGAVDLTVADENGIVLDMGSGFDDLSEKAGTAYFEKKIERGITLSDKEREAAENRRALYHLMKNAGLENYSDEWWHYEYGDQNWAWNTGNAYAVYGMTSPDLPWLEIC